MAAASGFASAAAAGAGAALAGKKRAAADGGSGSGGGGALGGDGSKRLKVEIPAPLPTPTLRPAPTPQPHAAPPVPPPEPGLEKDVELLIQLLERTPRRSLAARELAEGFDSKAGRQREKAINYLLSIGRLWIMSDANGNATGFDLLEEKKWREVLSCGKEEHWKAFEVYKLIVRAGNRGLWIRDIEQRLRLKRDELNKMLKLMVSKSLVKSVDSVSGNKKKVYMAFECEPALEVTGRCWFSGANFDADFHEKLYQLCNFFFRQDSRPSATAREVLDFIVSLQVLKQVKVSEDDIADMLGAMVYDEVLEVDDSDDGERRFRPRKGGAHAAKTPVAEMPCLNCPLFERCQPGGVINPRDCEYISEWMKLAVAAAKMF
jgi:DNA-directed RNA polymerase III subunit RPC6